MGRVLLKLEELQDQQIADALTPRDRARKLSDRDHDAALELLKDPNLLQRITADFDACGVVGEETNRLAGYLAATSRKLDKPLAVLIQSSSSAGKTSPMIFLTTTSDEPDFELANRCLVLAVNEDRDQTQAIRVPAK